MSINSHDVSSGYPSVFSSRLKTDSVVLHNDVGENEGTVDDDGDDVGFDDGVDEGCIDKEGSDEGVSLDEGIDDGEDDGLLEEEGSFDGWDDKEGDCVGHPSPKGSDTSFEKLSPPPSINVTSWNETL